jgi:hypothetical protein
MREGFVHRQEPRGIRLEGQMNRFEIHALPITPAFEPVFFPGGINQDLAHGFALLHAIKDAGDIAHAPIILCDSEL